ncbi:MAG: hypothetical protein ACKVX7_01105 [Planctomycetota bacterium]
MTTRVDSQALTPWPLQLIGAHCTETAALPWRQQPTGWATALTVAGMQPVPTAQAAGSQPGAATHGSVTHCAPPLPSISTRVVAQSPADIDEQAAPAFVVLQQSFAALACPIVLPQSCATVDAIGAAPHASCTTHVEPAAAAWVGAVLQQPAAEEMEIGNPVTTRQVVPSASVTQVFCAAAGAQAAASAVVATFALLQQSSFAALTGLVFAVLQQSDDFATIESQPWAAGEATTVEPHAAELGAQAAAATFALLQQSSFAALTGLVFAVVPQSDDFATIESQPWPTGEATAVEPHAAELGAQAVASAVAATFALLQQSSFAALTGLVFAVLPQSDDFATIESQPWPAGEATAVEPHAAELGALPIVHQPPEAAATFVSALLSHPMLIAPAGVVQAAATFTLRAQQSGPVAAMRVVSVILHPSTVTGCFAHAVSSLDNPTTLSLNVPASQVLAVFVVQSPCATATLLSPQLAMLTLASLSFAASAMNLPHPSPSGCATALGAMPHLPVAGAVDAAAA